MVCTANNGRSPVAELVAQNYLKKVRADKDYQAISSGTMVKAFADGGFPIDKMVPMIDLAKNLELYGPNDLETLNTAIDDGDQATVESYFNQGSSAMCDEETESRDKLLLRHHIGSVKEKGEQTIARPDTVAVLTMDNRNYDRVGKIYVGYDNKPILSVVSILAGGELGSQIEDAFGLGEEAYERAFDQIINEVPRAIQKIVGA